MKKRRVIWFCTGVGIGLLLGGLLILRTLPEPQGVFQVLPYLMIGLGCGSVWPWTGGHSATKNLEKQS